MLLDSHSTTAPSVSVGIALLGFSSRYSGGVQAAERTTAVDPLEIEAQAHAAAHRTFCTLTEFARPQTCHAWTFSAAGFRLA